MNQHQRFYDWIASTPPLFKTVGPFANLQELDIEPFQLANYEGNPRLGFLYQHLCTELLSHCTRYSVELEELQINHASGKTLGAIDLILHNHQNNRREHWEVAIKFYLLHQGTWYGPNAHDQLDIKLARMLNHQLKMSSTKEFLSQHPEFEHVSEHLLMQGRLYINPFSEEKVPTECLGWTLDSKQITGKWCYQSQWALINEPLYDLDKAFWATGRQDYKHPIAKPSNRFIHAQTRGGQFWFVVPDHWPDDS
ncbi:DUF1853 family protein [Vibrio ostreicida]|uniref:DUF1853 family protein n=1 Tax=Vibrio ostreicida TaxID=526588 RepID=UPI003B5CC03B